MILQDKSLSIKQVYTGREQSSHIQASTILYDSVDPIKHEYKKDSIN